MSVYRPKGSPYYQFDFQWQGHRFHGSTKRTTSREAEAVERTEREHAKQRVAAARAVSTSLKLDDVAGRYWAEVGQHHVGAGNTERQITKLIEFLGKDTLITEITDDDVIRLVAWRRGHHVMHGKRQGPLITNFTVNDLTEQ